MSQVLRPYLKQAAILAGNLAKVAHKSRVNNQMEISGPSAKGTAEAVWCALHRVAEQML